MFKTFVNIIEIQSSKKIMRLHSDRGTEYDFSLFNKFYKQHLIIHETTVSYSPEMNGKVDRENRTLIELVVVIMLDFGTTFH